METRFKVFGHAVHPMLIVLPLGLFSIAVLADIAYLVTGNFELPLVAYWNIAVGIIGGLVAALFGFIDWLAIPAGTRAKSIGLWHGAGNVVIVGLFVVSWFMRQQSVGYAPSTIAVVLGLAGVGLALITAWLGGELVYRLRVGVDDDANLDATNSIGHSGLISVNNRPPAR